MCFWEMFRVTARQGQMAPVFEFVSGRFSIGSVLVPGRNLRTAETESTQFEVNAFLANAGLGRRIIQVKTKSVLFSQGHAADSVFYLQKGCAKLIVVSSSGKEATIALFSAGDFIGEESDRRNRRPSISDSRHDYRV